MMANHDIAEDRRGYASRRLCRHRTDDRGNGAAQSRRRCAGRRDPHAELRGVRRTREPHGTGAAGAGRSTGRPDRRPGGESAGISGARGRGSENRRHPLCTQLALLADRSRTLPASDTTDASFLFPIDTHRRSPILASMGLPPFVSAIPTKRYLRRAAAEVPERPSSRKTASSFCSRAARPAPRKQRSSATAPKLRG